MRIIKFQAWNATTKTLWKASDIKSLSICESMRKMTSWGVYNGEDELMFGSDTNTNNRLIQFTGKLGHDKRELYEGDIVFYEEAGDNGDERHYLMIVYIEEWSMFASIFIDEYLKYLEKGAEALDEPMFWTYTLEKNSEDYHYAGNIYENPDLLK